eukprot:946721-Prorocentrum_lima.AAC.1
MATHQRAQPWRLRGATGGRGEPPKAQQLHRAELRGRRGCGTSHTTPPPGAELLAARALPPA